MDNIDFKNRPRKTIEQLQAEIVAYLRQETQPYSGEFLSGPCHGIARETGNEYEWHFYDALMGLVKQGIVEVIPTTSLSGSDWYKLARR